MFSHDVLNSLYRYGYSLTNNEADAYDLLQDALARFLENKPDHVSSGEAIPYLRRMMRNKFIDQLRRQQRFPLEVLDTVDPQIADSDDIELERIVIAQEMLEQIWSQLVPLERELIHLWAVEGFNAREIAEQLETPRGTILSRIHRLRKKIDLIMIEIEPQDDRGRSS